MTLLGWALMHSLWQGLAIALALASVLALTRSAQIRYAAGLASMGLMAVVFATTLVLSSPETMPGTTVPTASSGVSFPLTGAVRTSPNVAPSPLDFWRPISRGSGLPVCAPVICGSSRAWHRCVDGGAEETGR